jgi:hypothetical protein
VQNSGSFVQNSGSFVQNSGSFVQFFKLHKTSGIRVRRLPAAFWSRSCAVPACARRSPIY